ncbi:BnaAnng27070D, partial [Brassica napus]
FKTIINSLLSYMMRKTPQLSFTVLIIFNILVSGVITNAQEKRKYCDEQQLPVNKNGLCVDSECQAKCREKRGSKAKSTCFRSKNGKYMNCMCVIPC